MRFSTLHDWGEWETETKQLGLKILIVHYLLPIIDGKPVDRKT